MKRLALFAFAILLLPAAVQALHKAPHGAHADGVRDAVLDYVEGIYLVDASRIERSVSKDLVKRGYWRKSADADYREMPMNYEQLYELAASWNKDGRVDAETAPKEIVVFDVLDKTASAKLVAAWGIDYFHLENVDGKWMIKNVLWQSPPAPDES